MTFAESNRRIFLVHWHELEAEAMAHTLRQMAWLVAVVSHQDDLDLKIVRQQPPKAAIISLGIFPQRGHKLAETLWLTSWGRSITLIFLNCPPHEELGLHQEFPEAIFTDWDTLPLVLSNIPDKRW